MKKLNAFTMILVMLLASCTLAAPESVISTPVEITAEMSTVIAETSGPPSMEGPFPTLVPASLTDSSIFYTLHN